MSSASEKGNRSKIKLQDFTPTNRRTGEQTKSQAK